MENDMPPEPAAESTHQSSHPCQCENDGPSSDTCCETKVETLAVDDLVMLSIDDLIARYRCGVENYSSRVFNMPDNMLDLEFSAEIAAKHQTGLWSIRTLLGHCADAELVYVHRFRRAVAEDAPVNPNWDEQAFLDSSMYTGPVEGGHQTMTNAPSIAGHVAIVHTLRQWTAEWLSCLNEDQWDRKLMHPWFGEMTLKRLVATQTWHLEHHARHLAAKVDQLLGPAPAQSCCQSDSSAESNHAGCCHESHD